MNVSINAIIGTFFDSAPIVSETYVAKHTQVQQINKYSTTDNIL
jgi:hypothetical protein